MTARIKLKYIDPNGDVDEVKMDVEPDHRIEDLMQIALDFWEDDADIDDFIFLKDGTELNIASTVQEEGVVKDDTLLLERKEDLSPTDTDEQEDDLDTEDKVTSEDTLEELFEGEETVKDWLEEEIGISKDSLEFTSKEKLRDDFKRFELEDDDGNRFQVIFDGEEVVHYKPLFAS